MTATMPTLDDLLSGGSKSFKFERPGDTVTGTIATPPASRQATEFGTGTPETWDDGRPKMQVVITLDTNLRETPDDDGRRSVYIKGWGPQLNAFRAACQAAGAKPKPGDTFTAKFTGEDEKSTRGGFAPKLYAYKLKPSSGVDSLLGDVTTPQQPVAPADPWNTPAPATSNDDRSPADIETAKRLIAAQMTDDVIRAAVPHLNVAVIAALRNAS